MNPYVAALIGAAVVLGAVVGLVLGARVRRTEINSESTIIIPAGEAGIGSAQWDGMIRRSFPDDHLRRR